MYSHTLVIDIDCVVQEDGSRQNRQQGRDQHNAVAGGNKPDERTEAQTDKVSQPCENSIRETGKEEEKGSSKGCEAGKREKESSKGCEAGRRAGRRAGRA